MSEALRLRRALSMIREVLPHLRNEWLSPDPRQQAFRERSIERLEQILEENQ